MDPWSVCSPPPPSYTANHRSSQIMIEPEPKESINPYAVPQSSSVIDAAPSDPNPPPLQLPLVFTKWLLVCILAAGPSFYFGGMLGGFRLSAVTGMGIGILIFVIAYTAIEYTSAVQRQMRKPVSRRASWIAYSTRIIISVIFPIGIFVDVFWRHARGSNFFVNTGY